MSGRWRHLARHALLALGFLALGLLPACGALGFQPGALVATLGRCLLLRLELPLLFIALHLRLVSSLRQHLLALIRPRSPSRPVILLILALPDVTFPVEGLGATADVAPAPVSQAAMD